MQVLNDWLVPLPGTPIALGTPVPASWTSAASMASETAGSRAMSRAYFDRVIDMRALPPSFADAIVEYASRRAVSKIVDREYFAVYRGRAEARYFGGRVPRDLRLRIPVEGDADRPLQTLFTLERWVGRPVFDSILLEFVTSSQGKRPTLDDFVRVASQVSGQDVRWLIEEGLKPGVFDYAVETFSSDPEPGGTFHTAVTVRRLGNRVFGRRIPVVTTFADGETVREAFDGRSDTATYEYRSPSRATTASVDPDGVLVLDQHRSNNGMTLDTAAARTAADRWAARWMIWFEDALLTYVALT
jgi:hypothetical protein